jgi:gliding motility-associated-like protein
MMSYNITRNLNKILNPFFVLKKNRTSFIMKTTIYIISILFIGISVKAQNNTIPDSCTCTGYGNTSVNVPFFIPNLITCNGDGLNDSFIIPGLGTGVTLEVYNSWGKNIFRKENYDKEMAWNGASDSDGMYYFVLYFPENKQFKGWVQLIH